MSYSISRKYQRKGLMFEATSAVISQLFYVEGIDYINCGHFPFNTASEGLLKKLGFEYLTTMSYYEEGREIVVIHRIIFNHNV